MLRTLATFAFVLTTTISALADGTTPRASDPDARERVVALRDALKNPDAAAKKAAVDGCGLNPHAQTAMALGPVLFGEADDLRIAAAQALGKMKLLAEAAKVLHAGIGPNAKKPAVLEAIFKAVGTVKHESSVPVCRKFAIDYLSVADPLMGAPIFASVEALGCLRLKDSVEAVVAVRRRAAGTRTAPQATRDLVESGASAALEKLTGESIGDVEQFETWWKRHAYTFNDDMTVRPRGYRRGPGNNGDQ